MMFLFKCFIDPNLCNTLMPRHLIQQPTIERLQTAYFILQTSFTVIIAKKRANGVVDSWFADRNT